MVRYSTNHSKQAYAKVIEYSHIARFIKYSIAIILLLLTFRAIITPISIPAYAAQQSSYIVIEASSKRVLQGSNINARLEMASTTKVVTALIVLEKLKSTDIVTIPKEAEGVEGSSIYLKTGEKLTVKELLYGLMLQSGNDAAVALAVQTAGSIENFSKLMNEKALSLNLQNSNFTNPHGLHDPNHYTSAYDLAVLTSEAFKNEIFREIVSTKSISIKGREEGTYRFIKNKNKLLNMYDGANGVKTGFTKAAGRCLVASSCKDDMQVISVALNCYDMWERCSALMDASFKDYEMKILALPHQPLGNTPIANSRQKFAGYYSSKKIAYPIKKNGSEQVLLNFSQNDNYKFPIKKGEEIGKLEVMYNNHLLFSEKAYNIDTITQRGVLDYFRDLVEK